MTKKRHKKNKILTALQWVENLTIPRHIETSEGFKPLTMVRIRKDMRKKFEDYVKNEPQLGQLLSEPVLIYLGDIPNMPGHAVFAGHKSGRIYSAYHPDEFEQVPIDEI